MQEQVAAVETEMKAMQTEHRANLTAAIGQLANAVSQVQFFFFYLSCLYLFTGATRISQ